METLYDLLGALPNDDAENLRAAFRRAVKGTHPDINPGDPAAAIRFRQIVRANEILNDPDQRAAYDHLLDLARIEQASMAKQATARRVYQFASAVLSFAVVLIMAVTRFTCTLPPRNTKRPLSNCKPPCGSCPSSPHRMPPDR
jgi:curved DNA-binding protein CbpA